jgi:uncharacterized protein (DUF362 family)
MQWQFAGLPMMDEVFMVTTAPVYPDFPFVFEDSSVTKALASLFVLWDRDPENPFKDWISSGERVVIKPNWVFDRNLAGYNLDSLITHSALIKHLIELLAKAMKGQGSIIIGDAPIQGCNFTRLLQLNRMEDLVRELKQRYPKLDLLIEDWRLTVFENVSQGRGWLQNGVQSSRSNHGSAIAESHCLIDLGCESFLEEVAEYSDRFRVAMYDPNLMAHHHCAGKHEYLVTIRVFEADLVINVPKMKTHAKAGLTGALKNVVGINGHKEYLPHHIAGSYFSGGDNYCMPNRFRSRYEALEDNLWKNYGKLSSVRRLAYMISLGALAKLSRLTGSEEISSGAWSGNETIWRMTLDLNHLLYFHKKSRRRIITIVDGIISGEGDGPLRPTPKPVGLLIGGENPAYIDAVIGKLMGYNIARVPTVYHALYNRKSRFGGQPTDLLEVRCILNGKRKNVIPFDDLPNLQFKKPIYWKRAETVPTYSTA